jgi:hypothetical protein
MLEEIYSAFVAREDAAISRWDSSSIIEKIQAVSMKIEGCVRDAPFEEGKSAVVVGPAAQSRFTAVDPLHGVQVRRKQMSAKSMELGLSADEIREDTAAETARVLAGLAGTAGHSITVTMPVRGCSQAGESADDSDEELIDHDLLVNNVKLLMSAQQVTAVDLAAEIDCPGADIKAWLNGRLSPIPQRRYDQVMWELQCEQPPWWASRPIGKCLWAPVPVLAAVPAEVPAAAPAEEVTAQVTEVPTEDQQHECAQTRQVEAVECEDVKSSACCSSTV